jgi:alkylated DNA repair dioxygenase AlkB
MIDGVKIYEGFVKNQQQLHDKLWSTLPLIQHDKVPRWECWMNDYGLPYTYGKGAGKRTYLAMPHWNEDVVQVRMNLQDIVGSADMNCCFVNGYKDGHDQLGWHSDDSPEMDDCRPIVSVSLGAEREIWFRQALVIGWGETKKLSMPPGSALVMEPGFQDLYQHRIPKSSRQDCGPRLSLTFRGLLKL